MSYLIVAVLLISQGHTGSDNFGYYFLDSDTIGPEFLWVEPVNAETLTLADDDNSLISLPFPFPFYNSTIRQIYVVSNGFLTSTNTRSASNVSIPDTFLNNLIAPFWDDLNPANGGCVLSFYDSTLDAFVIQWQNIPHYGNGGPYTFEVILFRNGNLAFSYLHVGEPRNSSTIGIQGGSGENGFFLPYIYNGSPFEPHDSLTVMFYRPGDVHLIDVFPSDFVYPDTSIFPSGFHLSLEVEILNGGTDTVTTSVHLELRKLPGDTVIYSDVQAISGFPPYSLDTVNFEVPGAMGAGFYETEVITSTPGDTNFANDTLIWSFLVPDSTIDFEENQGNFVSLSGWEWGIPTVGPSFAHSGDKVWGTVLNGNYSNRADYQLIGRFVAVDSFAAFGFFHWFDMERRMDGGNVSVSINSDSSWRVVYPERGYTSFVFPLGDDGFTGTSDGWQDAVFRLDSLSSGDTIYIRLRFKSGRSNTGPGWYVDDFSYHLLEPVPIVGVSEDGSRVPEISLVKNVVKNKLIVRFEGKNRERLEIFNISGRRVMSFKIRAGINEVILPEMASGVYFLRVSGVVERFLVVK